MTRAVVLVLALVASLAQGAPVPQSTNAMTRAALVGTWRYEYGDQRDGVISLFADGNYFARHNLTSSTAYTGYWWIAPNGSLVLAEWSLNLCPIEPVRGNPNHYEFRLKRVGENRYEGNTEGKIRVVLSNPQRPEE